MVELTARSAIVNRFRSWLSVGLNSKSPNTVDDDETRMEAALCIGNLARSGKVFSFFVFYYI